MTTPAVLPIRRPDTRCNAVWRWLGPVPHCLVLVAAGSDLRFTERNLVRGAPILIRHWCADRFSVWSLDGCESHYRAQSGRAVWPGQTKVGPSRETSVG